VGGGKLSFQCLRPSASLRAAGKKGNLYFSVTREKGKGEGGRRKHHFREIRQLSAISADDS
jgi:hypothetical protein